MALIIAGKTYGRAVGRRTHATGGRIKTGSILSSKVLVEFPGNGLRRLRQKGRIYTSVVFRMRKTPLLPMTLLRSISSEISHSRIQLLTTPYTVYTVHTWQL